MHYGKPVSGTSTGTGTGNQYQLRTPGTFYFIGRIVFKYLHKMMKLSNLFLKQMFCFNFNLHSYFILQWSF